MERFRPCEPGFSPFLTIRTILRWNWGLNVRTGAGTTATTAVRGKAHLLEPIFVLLNYIQLQKRPVQNIKAGCYVTRHLGVTKQNIF